MGLLDIAKKDTKGKRGRPPKIKKGKEPKNITDIINDETKNNNEKAKETVEQLLADSPINDVLNNDNLLDLEENKNSVLSPETKEWFEEQLDLLTKENEELRKQLSIPQTSNEEWIIKLFIEMQNHYLKHLPTEKSTRVPTTVKLKYILDYFINHFACIEKYKKI